MISFKIKIAEKVINICCNHTWTKEFCKNFLSEEEAEIYISVNSDDIDEERVLSEKADKELEKEIYNYSDAYLETLAVHRKIVSALNDYDILLFHASVIEVDGEAYAFTAKSGTGKSTHASLWRKHFKDKGFMVNDDKPLLLFKDNKIYACGTPWNGKHNISNDIISPLKAITLIYQDSENHIEKLSNDKKVNMAMEQIFRPPQIDKTIKTLNLIEKLLTNIPIYEMGCNICEEAVIIAYDKMKG